MLALESEKIVQCNFVRDKFTGTKIAGIDHGLVFSVDLPSSDIFNN